MKSAICLRRLLICDEEVRDRIADHEAEEADEHGALERAQERGADVPESRSCGSSRSSSLQASKPLTLRLQNETSTIITTGREQEDAQPERRGRRPQERGEPRAPDARGGRDGERLLAELRLHLGDLARSALCCAAGRFSELKDVPVLDVPAHGDVAALELAHLRVARLRAPWR